MLRRLRTGLAFVAIAWFTGPAAASAQAGSRPIKEFEVVAVEPAGLSETGRNLDDLDEHVVRAIRSAGFFDPDFPGS